MPHLVLSGAETRQFTLCVWGWHLRAPGEEPSLSPALLGTSPCPCGQGHRLPVFQGCEPALPSCLSCRVSWSLALPSVTQGIVPCWGPLAPPWAQGTLPSGPAAAAMWQSSQQRVCGTRRDEGTSQMRAQILH